MPTSTWENLPDAKRARILDAALDLADRSGLDLEAAVSGYVDVLEAAFGLPDGHRPPADLVRALEQSSLAELLPLADP